jgi:hypothetical protein
MKSNSIYRYYAFGFNYYILLNNSFLGKPITQAIIDIDKFFDKLTELDLPVTTLAASDLRKVRDRLEEHDEKSVPEDLSTAIKKAVSKLDVTLDAEIQLRRAYIMTKKRFPLESLTSSAEDLLAKGVWDRLSLNAKKDFRLAARLIALSQPTASAFHLMRCLEECVRCLYYAFKKRDRMDKPMWGPMTAQLRAKRAPKPSEKLLSHLDGMRVHFRNPTQHPEAFYTLDEAQDLLSQTVVAINMVWAEIPA